MQAESGLRLEYPPSSAYTGTIDGQGHALRGLTVEQGAYAGLIGYADGVCVKDLTLENVYIEAENNAACVIARAEGDVTIPAVLGIGSFAGGNRAKRSQEHCDSNKKA